MATRNGKTRHGLNKKEIYLIAKRQGFMCALTGHDFWADKEMKVLLSTVSVSKIEHPADYPEVYNGYSNTKGDRFGSQATRVCIDHDHTTNIIRGVLSQEGNILCRDTTFNGGKNNCFFGIIPEPKSLKEYRRNPPAVQILGERQFK